MTPLTSFLAGLQIISSWLMSALAIIAIILSVIVSLAFVELVLERGALARAYTVKINSSDNEVKPAQNANKN